MSQSSFKLKSVFEGLGETIVLLDLEIWIDREGKNSCESLTQRNNFS